MPSHSTITLYEPGDVVKVRDDIISSSNKPYADIVFYPMSKDLGNYAAVSDKMARLAGECVTIEWVEDRYDGKKYHIREDGGAWCWTDGMFSGYANEVVLPDPDVDYDVFDWNE